ncbi:hypothetical protein Rmet_3368 [Cupriavidus metallidurans CH34]|uniref:N-acetyltransferase domain-containing protein n=2 Tax=Cupriavidus metallidurans TaxID=119219 RepID=Q1LHY6_CUPMC|nr:hypothetical protein Rmet_3368 [Cupriavidus metallidurans CH34]
MSMNSPRYALNILRRYEEVAPFLQDVQEAADSARDSLGFFPHTVYSEYARKGNLFVAVVDGEEGRTYAGHLLIDLRPPMAKVLQVFVNAVYRRLHTGTALLSNLKAYLTDLQFISITARVGEDMIDANAFWESQAFYAQRLVPGGASRRRMIVVRSHELATPQLFDTSGIDSCNPFGLNFAAANEKPTYLLDMNVLFDLGPRRQRREDVANVFRAERMQVCSLAVSSEIQAELVRTCPAGKTDPMQDFAAILPTYSVPSGAAWDKIADELGPLVFPERTLREALTANDVSDLRHLGTAIFHGLRGLVTSDTSVLAAAPVLRDKYGIEVLSPSAFSVTGSARAEGAALTANPNVVLSIEEAKAEDEDEIRALLTMLGVSHAQQLGQWAAVDGSRRACHRYIVRHGTAFIGYVMWPQTAHNSLIAATMAVVERDSVAIDAVRLMLGKLNEQITDGGVKLIQLTFPDRQAVIREAAVALGFAGSKQSHTQLQKIAINGVVTAANWKRYRDALASTCGVRLPSDAPHFRSVGQHIEVYTADGNRTLIPLLRLESVLSPALFCLPGRTGVIVPLRREFAEHLLRHLRQKSLLPQPRAQLYQQRHYVSGPKTLAVFTPGSLMLFYESEKGKGLGAIVAAARVVRSYHQNRDAMGHSDLDASVLEPDLLEEIGRTETRTVTVFDNLIIFPTPVPRKILLELGCGEPVQLLSSRRINDEQVQGILTSACI